MNTTSEPVINLSNSKTHLAIANQALRSKDYLVALESYLKVFSEHPKIFKSLAINVYYIQRQVLNRQNGLLKAPVAICSWQLFIKKNRNRAFTLANLYRAHHHHDVQIINCINPTNEQRQTIVEGVQINTFQLRTPDHALNQAIFYVLNNPYQIVHLTSINLPNLLLGVLYKLIWNAGVIADMTNRTHLDLGNLSTIAYKLDSITVTDATLQSRFGGWVLEDVADLSYLPLVDKLKYIRTEALYNLIEMQFESVHQIMQAIESEPKDSILFSTEPVSSVSNDAQENEREADFVKVFKDEIAYIKNLGYLNLDVTDTVHYLFDQNKHKYFLRNLFSAGLGRKPHEHEANHYENLLETKKKTRLDIAKIVFEGAESLRYIKQIENTFFTKQKFDLPKLGDIQPDDIELPLHVKPVISILIPVYSKVEFTLACLKSIAQNLPKISFEIIVLDDRSPDDSVKVLQKVKNIQVIINPKNLGFTKSCNYGAKYAKGEYIYFLNNDVKVHPNWLDMLYQTFELFPGTAIVGSKLVYPDGSLQEAGGIIWQDGSAWNFGRNQRPDLPVFNYAREVDYVSGASLMIPKKIFDEIGGFNEIYAPAYCEDSDLALHARSMGYRVIYQPLSVITHFEGVSSGTDTGSGIKSYQVRNLKTMYELWKDLLASHAPNGVSADQEKDRMINKRVLVLEPTLLTPDNDAGSVTTFNLLILMREMGFGVTFIPEDNLLYQEKYAKLLQKIGVEVLYRPFISSVEAHIKEYGNRYDLAFLFRPQVVQKHLAKVKQYCPKAKILFYTHDLHHLRMMREAELLADEGKKLAALEMKDQELRLIQEVDSSIVVSAAEYELLKPEIGEAKVEVLPLVYDIPGTNIGYENRSGLVFIGGSHHPPNNDAIHFMIREIMPILRKKIPGITLNLVGGNPPPDILALEASDVVIHGRIDNLNAFLDTMKLSIAPMRFGAGMKGKVCSAIGSGLPTVLTSIAAEGIGLENGVNAMIADKPQEIADGIIKIYNNKILWESMSKKGIKVIENLNGPISSYQKLSDILERIQIPIKNKLPKIIELYKDSFI